MVTICLVTCVTISTPHSSAAHDAGRRSLTVALYPYVPERAEMYWAIEQAFEDAHPSIDVRFVDIGAYYYSGQLIESLEQKKVDVVEVDTVFLHDLVTRKLIDPLPDDVAPKDQFLPVAATAAVMDGKLYGAPHWVCGNFLFFRKDDPETNRFRTVDSIDDLERLIGHPLAPEQSILVDLRGSSTLGEKYLDALLDTYETPGEALKHLSDGPPDAKALQSLNRIYALCPGGLCDSDKHHEFSEFYPRQFAERRCRAFLGYSERLHFVVSHFLNGIREDQSAVGKIEFVWRDDTSSYEAVGGDDIDVVPATLADDGAVTLTWVDILSIRHGLNDQARHDAIEFIRFATGPELSSQFLIPDYGHAPRYLLPARESAYCDARVLKAAPLYRRFHTIMREGTSITGPALNDRLRAVGKQIEEAGFSPRSRN